MCALTRRPHMKPNPTSRSRVLLNNANESYYVPDLSRDYHSEYGFIKADVLQNAPDGARVKTSKEKEFTIFDATSYDRYRRLKRVAAIILPKEAGAILANTMIDSESVCVDAGGGSGALTCFLAQFAKKVYCYDIRQDHLDVVKKNVESLGLSNVDCALGDVYESIPVADADLITLDVPEPHRALDNVAKSLRAGRFLVCYLPNANQVQTLANAILTRPNADFVVTKTIEIIEREWEVDARKNRPANTGLMHTAFLTFIRKI